MTDQVQLGDWWLASDGKWYPPEARPAPQPLPPPPPPPPGYYAPAVPAATYVYSDVPRPPGKALSGWLQGLCWATSGLLLALAISCIATATTFQRYWTSTGSQARDAAFADWDSAEGVAGFFYGTAVMVWLAAIILMMVWMSKAHRASSRLWPGHRSWSSGWCVGGWFIPLANFVIPKLVLLEIERVIGSIDERGEFDPGWRTKRGSAIGWVFWIAIVVALVTIFVGAGVVPASVTGATESEADRYVVAMVIFSVATAIGAVGALCGGLHFRSMGRTLTAAADSRTAAVGSAAWSYA